MVQAPGRLAARNHSGCDLAKSGPDAVASTMAQINLEHVTKEFPGNVVAVNDVSFSIEDGEFMVLVGPSGCGKTTLLRSIGGLEGLTSGRIFIGDKDVSKLPPGARDLAMVFQNYALYPHMTVRQNLGYSLRVHKMPRQEIARRVQAVAEMLGLDQLLDRRPGALSGGQQQRVAMGRAIIREPAAFLMDEPLSNLDAKLRVTMRSSLQDLHDRLGTTTVYVTHDQVEAMTLGDRVAVVHEGRIQQLDTPQRLYNDPANVFVAAFIGSPPMNLVLADVADGTLTLGEHLVPLGADDRHGRVPDGRVVVGIRPEAFEDISFAEPDRPHIDVTIDVVEELGSDTHVGFGVSAEPVMVEAARSDDSDDDGSLLIKRDRTRFIARVDPRTQARVHHPLRLSLDTTRLYFFDPESGESLLREVDAAAA
jgi:multiple sugar transport system ATP-binding protein